MNELAKKKKKGFTLIALIAVIAIIGILAAVLVPRIVGYMNDANDAKTITQARNVRMAYETMISKDPDVFGADTADDVTVQDVVDEYDSPTDTSINWEDYTSLEAEDYDRLDTGVSMTALKAATASGDPSSIAN